MCTLEKFDRHQHHFVFLMSKIADEKVVKRWNDHYDCYKGAVLSYFIMQCKYIDIRVL
jgi:hypothetical protein